MLKTLWKSFNQPGRWNQSNGIPLNWPPINMAVHLRSWQHNNSNLKTEVLIFVGSVLIMVHCKLLTCLPWHLKNQTLSMFSIYLDVQIYLFRRPGCSNFPLTWIKLKSARSMGNLEQPGLGKRYTKFDITTSREMCQQFLMHHD